MSAQSLPAWLQAKISVAVIRQRGSILVNPQDGSLLIPVPAGVFEMGDGERSDAPKHKVELSEYWIGANCVTNRQYARYLNEAKPGQEDEKKWILMNKDNFVRRAGSGYEAYGGKENHPIVHVSWFGAEAYAKWAGGTLPTEAQWENAAKGPLGLKYPWGTEYNPDLCRNYGNKGTEKTASVNAYPKGVSGYGTYQQSGNVREWCRDWYEAGYYSKPPAKNPGGPDTGSLRVYRGGCWTYLPKHNFLAGLRGSLGPVYRHYSLGFRLVRAV